MKTRELRMKRTNVIAEAQKLLDERSTEWNEADETRYAELTGQIESLDQQIKRMEEIEARGVDANVAAARQVEVTVDEADRDFASTGEFFQAVRMAKLYPEHTDVRLRSRWTPGESRATGLSEGVPADGGYLLSPGLSAKWLEPAWNTGAVLSRVSRDPLGPNSNSMLYNGVDETSRVAGSRKGGITTYWLGEGSTITASKPQFRQVEIKLRKAVAMVYATSEQLEDTANLESFLNRSVPDELRFAAEDAIIEGLGGGQPLGIMSAPSLISPLRVDANLVQYADAYTMWGRRYTGVNDYVWLVNQSVTPQLLAFALSGALNTNFFAYMPDGSMRMGGAPVIEVEYCQALGTAGDILLVSLSQYQTIDRGGVKGQSSIHVSFATDETAFRFIYRFGGAPLWHSAVTPLHGSNTVSPFVALSAASA